MKLDFEDYAVLSYINSNEGREGGVGGFLGFAIAVALAKLCLGLLALAALVIFFYPIILAWLALGVGGIVVLWALISAAKDAAASRVPTAEEKLAADQARFNEWCKSRGL